MLDRPAAVVFSGLSAFPLTPLREDRFDDAAYRRIIDRLVAAGVDAIGALGSTGSYAYLGRAERARIVQATVEHAGTVPVLAGIGALRTSDVLAAANDAQQAGADAVLLAPVSYQRLTDAEVLRLYEDVTAELSVPLVVYDNPATTGYRFSLEMYTAVTALPQVAAIKIPPPTGRTAREWIGDVRGAVPTAVAVGISGDPYGAAALNAGADGWFSVIGGTLPEPALAITRAARNGHADRALADSDRLGPLWDLFAAHGSLRVVASIAEQLGLTAPDCLPRPLLGLSETDRAHVARVLDALGVSA